MPKKVIIFGGLGFLGGFLKDELLSRNYNLTLVDNIDLSEDQVGYKYKVCDIMDAQSVDDLISEGFDYVYNLAGLANIDSAVSSPFRTLELNVLGNINILNAAAKYNVERFVYASSAYAMNSKGSFYGISKFTSEKIIEEYQKTKGLNFTILRYGSVYANRDFDNNYIYQLVKEMVTTGEISHGGDGEEVREYIHAQDAAKLSVDIIESDEYINQHIILTGQQSIKRKDLFLLIKEILGEDVKIELANDGYGNHYKYTPYEFSPAVSKKLSANPHIDLGQGILECIRDVHRNKDDSKIS